MKKTYKMIDLFSGAGGLTWGFYKEGFDPVETVEFWEPATKTYNKNFHKNVLPTDITEENVIEKISNYWKNSIDLIIGGFPCQGYSMAGKRDKNDPRNQLYKYTIKMINNIMPNVFVLENVKGILSFKESDNKLVIEKIENSLFDIGYYTRYILLDATNFDVPQKRERVIFIGSKFEHRDKVDICIQKLESHKSKLLNVFDAIGDLEDKPENFLNSHIFTKHSVEMVEKIKNTPIGKSAMKNFSDAFRKLDYFKPSYTVKENHGGVHLHPKLPRVLTPRELARLQTFPDDFIFLGTKSDVLKQIGNAVPCNLSKHIAKIIKEVFYGK